MLFFHEICEVEWSTQKLKKQLPEPIASDGRVLNLHLRYGTENRLLSRRTLPERLKLSKPLETITGVSKQYGVFPLIVRNF